MNKDELTNKKNKSYPDNNISEKYDSEIDYDKMSKVKDDEESKKYIKEMYEFADKSEFKSNSAFLGIGMVIVLVIILSVFMKFKTDAGANKVVTKNTTNNSSAKINPIKPANAQAKIFDYLIVEANRTSVLKKAVELNKGSQKGVTIYLLSEILRVNSFDIPVGTSSVEQLMKSLTDMNWKKNTDFTQLKKGDICFTLDVPKKPGVPSHAYVFMGWVEDGKTDYAYVCDGQIEDYSTVLHQRNISISTPQKDKFSFFLRK